MTITENPSTALAISASGPIGVPLSTDADLELLRKTLCKDADEQEFRLFVKVCHHTGLDPFMKQIYAVSRFSKREGRKVMTIQTGIDGYRLIAARTGSYAGSDDATFEYVGADQTIPAKASVTVWKFVQGHRVAFSASARWAEYYPGDKDGHMWRQLPHVMLAKVAEALALRKAFPAELSGIYTTEEMDQAGEPKSRTVKDDLLDTLRPMGDDAKATLRAWCSAQEPPIPNVPKDMSDGQAAAVMARALVILSGEVAVGEIVPEPAPTVPQEATGPAEDIPEAEVVEEPAKRPTEDVVRETFGEDVTEVDAPGAETAVQAIERLKLKPTRFLVVARQIAGAKGWPQPGDKSQVQGELLALTIEEMIR